MDHQTAKPPPYHSKMSKEGSALNDEAQIKATIHASSDDNGSKRKWPGIGLNLGPHNTSQTLVRGPTG